ncbi:ABC-type transport system permease protein (probable substrate dipeptide/oligopeptide) [Natrialba magadii ATCC 43099]|uniref:ABC transporter permease n=1 Tax=Natrialba magadii (strain ATCC 43099 / DSM 3394 / CCM 3739 / CIP 104546 / IAM 13178 / JCM 8861 / NBRC 102185 / NCIMB 2190 / MS3) TaxID=547559 RepID=D3SY82_NATMM|nr:ABC transporter permease [Natrialba magadii]ADD06053.1 ABC-type transport system permease protein (probable substrate dipeptide/oligopeptide) [Natrialba magadii ATCC 43099]ELY30950.1 ABC transporter permease [Natrialba magadii ATCC 43099]
MTTYILRRVAWAVVASLIILTLTFMLLYFTPDTQLAEMQFQAAQAGEDPEEIGDAYESYYGYDQPVHVQYVDFMGNMLSLDWGWSETRSQPVTTAIADAIPYSMMYGVPSIIISTILGIGIGLYSATNQYTRSDYAATFFAFFGLSIPDFWFAIILLVIFGVVLGWVPILFDTSVAIFSLENAQQLILPVIVLTLSSIASLMRYSRAEALEYVEAEFVKTAKAKGVKGRRILSHHIFRPASVPLATILVGDLLGIILVSSYLIEVVYGIPGLGTLSFRAIINQDTPLVMGTVLLPAFLTIIGNLAQDIAYTVLDPRIDYGDA